MGHRDISPRQPAWALADREVLGVPRTHQRDQLEVHHRNLEQGLERVGVNHMLQEQLEKNQQNSKLVVQRGVLVNNKINPRRLTFL